jgi:hemerythrin superfamily protein
MKATDVIRRDHRAAEELFEKYKAASRNGKEALIEKIFEALDTHESMEDSYFYPSLDDLIDDEATLEALEEEQADLKEEVAKIKDLDDFDEQDEALKDVMAKVLAHAKKEETIILPLAEEALSAEDLEELGARMEAESAVANS